uniref:Uncharacterized protein n=1 Tax=Panagrolaimus sp. JU765 TaxID=591449 RepID=A0AC34QT00_9BILA
MPQVAVVFRGFPQPPIPSIKSYLTVSTFLFFSGFYYYYLVFKSSNIILPFSSKSDSYDENGIPPVALTFAVLKELVVKHALLFYVLLNTLCALIVFCGKILTDLIIGPTSSQEDETLRTTYKNIIQCKLAFTVFLSGDSIIYDFLTWMPWIISTLAVTTLLDLMDMRIANPQHNTSNRTTRGKYLLTSIGSLIMYCGVCSYFIWAGDAIDYEYKMLMIADSLVIVIHAINVIHKIAMAISRPASDNISHYVSLFHSVTSNILDFYTAYHVYCYARSYSTVAWFFMFLQLRSLFVSVAETIRKHVRHQRIVNHINMCYPEAGKEDLLKQDSCTICWEPMEKARKLPCGHCFHEICLRRWLQHDSSCAVCRTGLSLHLSQVLRDDVNGDDDNGVGALIGMEMMRFLRWFHRVNFPPAVNLTPGQVQAMADQIVSVFPQYSQDAITNAVRLTGSVEQAVNYLLENGNNLQNNPTIQDAINEANFSDDSDSDVPDGPPVIANVLDAAVAAFSQQAPPVKEEYNHQNTWFATQRLKLIDECKRKYLASSRADDLRAFDTTGSKKNL